MLAIESTQHQHQHDLINDIDIDLIHQHQRQLNDFNIAQLQLQYEQCVFSSPFMLQIRPSVFYFFDGPGGQCNFEERSERAGSFEEQFETSPVLTVWLRPRATANRLEHNHDDDCTPHKILDTHPKLGSVYLTFCFGFDVKRP